MFTFKQMFTKAQLCASHCPVVAVVREMLDETHETLNAPVFGIVAICLPLCQTQSRHLKHIQWLINTILSYTNYNIGLSTCLFSIENKTSLT